MLTVCGISKTYRGGVEALTDVALKVEQGMFGLLGPNGAGKSTLMRTLATLQSPSAGSATVDDIDLLAEPMRARRVIGYLPQDAGAYPRVTAREMLDYLAGLRGIGVARERRTAVQRQIDRVNLTRDADRRLDTYSGGMLKRFGIATVFLTKPRLVIVDEPTAGLDPTERRRFQCMLAEASQGCVLLLSSHIVEDVAALCDRLALLDNGRIRLEGKPAHLVEELEGHVWMRKARFEELDELRRSYRVLSWTPKSGHLVVRAHGDALGEHGFSHATPELEDLYHLHVESVA